MRPMASWDAHARIGDHQLHRVRAQCNGQAEPTALLHGLDAVHEQGHHHLLDLIGVAHETVVPGAGRIVAADGRQFHAVADQQEAALDDFRKSCRGHASLRWAGEEQQVAHDIPRAAGSCWMTET